MATQVSEDPLKKIEDFEGFTKIKTKNPESYSLFRLIILSGVYQGKFVSFSQLKELTNIQSAGNLASHLRALENQKLIEYHGVKAGRRTLAFYSLTKKGKDEFEQVVFGLKKFLSVEKK